ncbi:MAG: YigZ family protein [Oscillospiraceae bacterium]|nr:YigZ family protein [Oscillospiraceae bacterium]
MEQYKTVLKPAKARFVEKKSEFISMLVPIITEKDASSVLEETRAANRKSRHNCYGYILRDTNTERYSDDGEPSGTAGMPILEVLKNNCLFDVMCIVTRYFGGVLLGAGGLTRAYSKSATMAVNEADIITMYPAAALKLKGAYTYYKRIKTAVGKYGGISQNESFSEFTEMTAVIRCEAVDEFSKYLTDICNGSVIIEFERELYIH